MFDFIKRMFAGKAKSESQDVAPLDVVEGNNIEILKTSDYSEGAPADAVEQLVADRELPPAELDLPMSDTEIPAAQLDEPSEEPDVPLDMEPLDMEPPDNYMLGDLDQARKLRAMQTSKAGIQYWSDGMMKYKPGSERPVVDGTNAKQFNYFDVLRDEPMLRQTELQRPGMSIDHLNLQRFVHKSLKGKMVSDYVLRSMKLNSASSSEEHLDASPVVDELLSHFEELFEHEKEDENNESYTRWLMSVAEEGNASNDILWLLVEDPNPDVRFCLAENYHIDADILRKLSEDDNPYVAHRAQKTLMRLQSPSVKVIDRDFGSAEVNRFRKSG